MTTEQLHCEFRTIIQQANKDQRACIGSPYYAFGYFEKFANKIRKEAASELSALQQQVQKADDMYSVARALVADQAKDIEDLSTQNRELREACKLSQIALKEYDLLVANGDFYFNCKCHKSGPAQQAINKALALQPTVTQTNPT